MSQKYCPKCKNKYSTFEKCPECDINLETPDINQQVEGNKNQTIQINGNNQGDIILQQVPEPSSQTTFINRQSINPIKIGKVQFKNWWLFGKRTINYAIDLIHL